MDTWSYADRQALFKNGDDLPREPAPLLGYDEETTQQIWSNSKTVTALCFAMLVDRRFARCCKPVAD